MSDFWTNGSFEFLKLHEIIFIELSLEPIATMLELGWKDREMTGDLQSLSRVDTVQHADSALLKPMATVLQDAPRPNFLPLGAHLTHRIDSLISMLTNIFCHTFLLLRWQMKTLLSWLPLMILSSFDQSISEMGWLWSCSSCRNYQLSMLAMSLTRKTNNLTFFLVARQQNSSERENAIAVIRFSYMKRVFDLLAIICESPDRLISYIISRSVPIVQQLNMKQLLSISKSRKSEDKGKKQLVLKQPEEQEQNFIYEDLEEEEEIAEQQVRTYANMIGIKLPEEEDLLYIAREGLKQPMPEEWRCEEDSMGEIIYVNGQSGQIKFEHPCDEVFRQKVISERKKKVINSKKSIPKINIAKSKTNFVDGVFKPKQSADNRFQEEIKQYNKPENIHKSKDLEGVINQNIKIPDALKFVENNDNDFEPVNPIRSRNVLGKQQKQMDLKPIDKKQQQLKASPIIVRPPQKSINNALLQQKKQAIEQKIKQKYAQLSSAAEQKYRQTIVGLRNKQNYLRNADIYELKQEVGEAQFQHKRKQIQTKLMVQHSNQLQKMRSQQELEHRRRIMMIGSETGIDGLFSEMAQCRKFLQNSVNKPVGTASSAYLDELQQNITAISTIQVQQMEAEIRKQGLKVMTVKLQEAIKKIAIQSEKTNSWQKRESLVSEFQGQIQIIIDGFKQNYVSVKNQMTEIQVPESKPMFKKQGQSIYQQMTSLKQKLRQLQDDSSTHRSNLSEKQTKLFELLQSRVTPPLRSEAR